MRNILLILILCLPLLGEAFSVQNIKIIDPDAELPVDTVVLPSGKRALQTSGLVQIDQLFGQDPQGTTFFYLGTKDDASGIGAAGDTITIDIVAATPPLNLIYPAVSVTTTVTAGHVADDNPERAVATQICNDLEADANFVASQFQCTVISDFSGVFINSRLYNEFGWRVGCTLPAKCFSVTSTGTTIVTEVYTTIEGRGFAAELQRSPNDPRKGVLAIAGSISINSQSVNNIISENLVNPTNGSNMAINGATTSQAYEFFADPTNTNDFFIQKISCYCQGNRIQLANYCSLNSPLSVGMIFSFISEGVTSTFAAIKSTANYKHIFTLGDATQYALDVPSGTDDLMATAEFDPPIVLLAGSGDKITATVNDNLSQLTAQECRVFGFKRAK